MIRAIAVVGSSKTGKTTVCELIIKELRRRGYTVGSIKEIHHDTFTIDPDPDTDTRRHRAAGSQLVTARGLYETDLLYQSRSSIEDILKHYDHDYVLLEGVVDCNVPLIITGRTPQEVQERLDPRAIAISGVLANDHSGELLGMPIFHAGEDTQALADFVEERAFAPLPAFDPNCCSLCGYSCRELAAMIAWKKADRNDCALDALKVELVVDGVQLKLVPFVQNILKNAVLGVAKELQGYKDHSEIVVRLRT